MSLFFNRGKNSSGTKSDIEVQFDKLVQSLQSQDGTDSLHPQHLVVLAEQLGIGEDDIALYVLAWKLKASEPMTIHKREWVDGLLRMRIDTMAKLKMAVPALRNELSDAINFRDFYFFVFDWTRESTASRYLPNETACTMWPLVFQTKRFPLLKQWLDFIANVYKKGISKDLWRQTLDFSTVDLNKYDSNGSWPTAMDEFVAWMKINKG